MPSMVPALPEGSAPLDFHASHRAELPRRLAAGNGALAADDVLLKRDDWQMEHPSKLVVRS